MAAPPMQAPILVLSAYPNFVPSGIDFTLIAPVLPFDLSMHGSRKIS
jgi:hypothetical protein